MTPIIAKVFQAGNFKALRLPRGLNVKVKSYHITPTGNGGFIVTDPAAEARRLKALKALWGSAPDFPDHTK
jgi:virulence-associated protein VagC